MERVFTNKNFSKRSKEFVSFYKIWEKTWDKLAYNAYYRFVAKLDVDLCDLCIVVDNEVCLSYKESDYDSQRYNWKSIRESVADLYPKDYSDLVVLAFTAYAEHINSYLDKHNIQLINTGRSQWKTMRFMNHFLGDRNSSKVVFWHERHDGESGEFVMCDPSFVKKCIKKGKMPDVPSVKIPRKWKETAKAWKEAEETKGQKVIAEAQKILDKHKSDTN